MFNIYSYIYVAFYSIDIPDLAMFKFMFNFSFLCVYGPVKDLNLAVMAAFGQ